MIQYYQISIIKYLQEHGVSVVQLSCDYHPVHLISLHIRSMWETICDAWACWSGWKFGANSTEYPYSVKQNTPPPQKNWNLARSWDFEYFQLQNTPPPENWNLARSWDFEYFQLQNTPPTHPPKLKFSQILGLWVFSIIEYPPPPKIEI